MYVTQDDGGHFHHQQQGRQVIHDLAFLGVPVGIFELVQRLRQSFQLAVQFVIEGSHNSARQTAIISYDINQKPHFTIPGGNHRNRPTNDQATW